MSFARLENSAVVQYPVTEQEIKQLSPNVSWPVVFVAPSNYVAVKPTDAPAFDVNTHSIAKGTPVKNATNEWVQTWKLVPLEAALVASNLLQVKSNLIQSIKSAIQNKLDTFAATRGYDSIISAASYATSKNTQRAVEGQCCVDLRDATWDIANNLEADVLAGTKPMPASVEEVLVMLPAMQWTN